MSLSEKNLKETILKEEELSMIVRNRLDATYKDILKEESSKMIKPKFRYIYPLIAVFSCIVIISMTPLGLAAVNLLRFGDFTSNNLKQSQFINRAFSSDIDQNIHIQLQEHYFDNNALGLHFSIKLSRDSKLLASDIEEYDLTFAISNKENQTIINFNMDDRDVLDNIQSVNVDHAIDRETNTLEMTYRLRAKETGELFDIKDATLTIGSISGVKNRVRTPGESHLSIEEIKGDWTFPIDLTTKEFDPIEFFSSEEQSYGVHSAIAYPTSFIVHLSKDGFEQFSSQQENGTFQLKVINGEKQQTYEPKTTKINHQNNQEFFEMTFEYSGYDQLSEVTLVINNKEEILLSKK